MSEIKVLENGNVFVTVPTSFRFRAGRKRLIFQENDSPEFDPLVMNLARGFHWQSLIDDGTYANIGAGGGHRHRFRRSGEGDETDAALADNRPQAHSRRSGPLNADPSAQFPSGLGKAGERAAEVIRYPSSRRHR